MRKIIKIVFSILIIMILTIQLLNIKVWAYDDIEDVGDQIYSDLQVLEFDSSLGIENYNVLNAIKQYKNNPQKMEEWTRAMIDIVKIGVDDGNAQRAQQLLNISNGEEDLQKCSQVAYKLIENLVFIADLDTYVTNGTQKKRAQEFRDLLLQEFGTNTLGPIQSKAESARLTYKSAASGEINNSNNNNELFHYTTEEQIQKYYKINGYNYPNMTEEQIKNLETKWRGIINKNRDKDNKVTSMKQYAEEVISGQAAKIQGATEDEVDEMDAQSQKQKIDKDKDTVFQQPTRVEDSDKSQKVIEDADEFLKEGKDKEKFIKEKELKEFSQTLYSILFGLGIIVAVIVGVIIGIKLMFAPVSQKADAKKMLIPYVAGCVLVFGAFGIWKIVVTIMQQV